MQSVASDTCLDIRGSAVLSGVIRVAGSKNAFHKLIAATVLVPGRHVLRRAPDTADARSLMRMVEGLGGVVTWNATQRTLNVDSRFLRPEPLLVADTLQSTGSFLFAGALLGRFGEARVGPPGGDRIGVRPVDRHLAAFESLGAQVSIEGDEYRLDAPDLTGGAYEFDKDTVNGTANALMAAVGARDRTVLSNASIDPDVQSLISFLQAAGVEIYVTAAQKIIVEPRRFEDTSVRFDVPPDRNDAATLLIAGALLGDPLHVAGVNRDLVLPLYKALEDAGVPLETYEGGVRVSRPEWRSTYPLQIESRPYPGFLTDWGPMLHVLLTQLSGTSSFHETIYSNRFGHVDQLVKLGARAKVRDRRTGGKMGYEFTERPTSGQWLDVSGTTQLIGAEVRGENLRAAAALLLAGLRATGPSCLAGAEHLDRGYDHLVERLRSVGAEIGDVRSVPLR